MSINTHIWWKVVDLYFFMMMWPDVFDIMANHIFSQKIAIHMILHTVIHFFLWTLLWLALARSISSHLSVNFLVVITFAYIEQQAFPFCATALIFLFRQSFPLLYYLSNIFLHSILFLSTSNPISMSTDESIRSVLNSFVVLFATPALAARINLLELFMKSFIEWVWTVLIPAAK